MKLPYNDDQPITQRVRLPAVGLALSALLHAVLVGAWLLRTPQPEQVVTPPQVIEVALVSAAPQPAAEPPPPAPVQPPPPAPPKAEKAPEKPAPKKPEKPKPKPLPKKLPRPEPPKRKVSAAPAATDSAATTPPVPAPSQAPAPSPAPFVEASYQSPALHNPPTRYPPLALERRWEGKVILRVQVLPNGKAGDIRIERSSGHDILDNATVEQVRGWNFVAARRGDQAVVSSVIVPIEYRLKH